MSANNLMIDCIWMNTLGIECPGCGFQRSLFLLFNGEVLASIQMFPALLPMLFLFTVLLFHMKFKFKHGALFLKWIFGFTMLLMIGNFAINLIERIYG